MHGNKPAKLIPLIKIKGSKQHKYSGKRKIVKGQHNNPVRQYPTIPVPETIKISIFGIQIGQHKNVQKQFKTPPTPVKIIVIIAIAKAMSVPRRKFNHINGVANKTHKEGREHNEIMGAKKEQQNTKGIQKRHGKVTGTSPHAIIENIPSTAQQPTKGKQRDIAQIPLHIAVIPQASILQSEAIKPIHHPPERTIMERQKVPTAPTISANVPTPKTIAKNKARIPNNIPKPENPPRKAATKQTAVAPR